MGRKGRVFGLLASLLAAAQVASAAAQESTRDQLDATRDQLGQAEQQLESVTAQVGDARSQLQAVDAKLVDATAQLRALEDDLATAAEVEAAAERRTREATRQLNAATRRMEVVQARLDEREDRFDRRVAATFKYGTPTYADALVGARSFPEFLNSLYYVESALAHDATLIDELAELHDEIREHRAEIDRLRDAAVEQERVAERARKHVDFLTGRQRDLTARIRIDRQERERLLGQLEATQGQYEELVASLEAESNALAEQLRREQEAAARAAAAAGKSLAGAPGRGELVWPTDGNVGSGYGYRTHPIYGTRRMHTGIDIAGPTGQPIVAAAAGVVVHAGWRGGYGLAVVIDHGGGLATLYGHMSSIAVGEGSWVEQGQTIGGIGSTGYSTGPHLHFEVREHGEPVDPMGYY